MTPVGRILVSLLDGARLELSLPELLCLRATTDLPVAGVAMTLADETGLVRSLAASDERAAALQQCQVDLGEGPCFDALGSGRPRQVSDLAGEGPQQWPGFTGVALAAGVRGVSSYPLRVGGIRLGVLDLFRDRAERFSDLELAQALHHVDAAVLVLLHLQEMGDPDLGCSWIDDAADLTLHGHAEVHQATGMVSVQADVPLAAALLLLRAHAFATDRSLVAVSDDVVLRRLRFGPEEVHGEAEDG